MLYSTFFGYSDGDDAHPTLTRHHVSFHWLHSFHCAGTAPYIVSFGYLASSSLIITSARRSFSYKAFGFSRFSVTVVVFLFLRYPNRYRPGLLHPYRWTFPLYSIFCIGQKSARFNNLFFSF